MKLSFYCIDNSNKLEENISVFKRSTFSNKKCELLKQTISWSINFTNYQIVDIRQFYISYKYIDFIVFLDRKSLAIQIMTIYNDTCHILPKQFNSQYLLDIHLLGLDGAFLISRKSSEEFIISSLIDCNSSDIILKGPILSMTLDKVIYVNPSFYLFRFHEFNSGYKWIGLATKETFSWIESTKIEMKSHNDCALRIYETPSNIENTTSIISMQTWNEGIDVVVLHDDYRMIYYQDNRYITELRLTIMETSKDVEMNILHGPKSLSIIVSIASTLFVFGVFRHELILLQEVLNVGFWAIDRHTHPLIQYITIIPISTCDQLRITCSSYGHLTKKFTEYKFLEDNNDLSINFCYYLEVPLRLHKGKVYIQNIWLLIEKVFDSEFHLNNKKRRLEDNNEIEFKANKTLANTSIDIMSSMEVYEMELRDRISQLQKSFKTKSSLIYLLHQRIRTKNNKSLLWNPLSSSMSLESPFQDMNGLKNISIEMKDNSICQSLSIDSICYRYLSNTQIEVIMKVNNATSFTCFDVYLHCHANCLRPRRNHQVECQSGKINVLLPGEDAIIVALLQVSVDVLVDTDIYAGLALVLHWGKLYLSGETDSNLQDDLDRLHFEVESRMIPIEEYNLFCGIISLHRSNHILSNDRHIKLCIDSSMQRVKLPIAYSFEDEISSMISSLSSLKFCSYKSHFSLLPLQSCTNEVVVNTNIINDVKMSFFFSEATTMKDEILQCLLQKDSMSGIYSDVNKSLSWQVNKSLQNDVFMILQHIINNLNKESTKFPCLPIVNFNCMSKANSLNVALEYIIEILRLIALHHKRNNNSHNSMPKSFGKNMNLIVKRLYELRIALSSLLLKHI